MLRRRALVVIAVSAVLASAGVAGGVEEFLLLAVSGVGMLAVGALALGWQVRRARQGLVLEIDRVAGELFVGAGATISLVGVNRGSHAVPPLWLRGAGHWQVAFPGLAAGAVDRPSPPFEAAAPRAASAAGTGRVRPRWRRAPSWWSEEPWTALPAIGPGRRSSVTVAVPTTSRGLWTWGPAELWCTDPFGLTAWRVAVAPVARAVVLPVPGVFDTADLPGMDPAPGRAGPGDDGPPAWTGGGDEFAGLRPYVPGDRLTRLHWPALARNDDLVARHFVEHRDPLELVIDTRPWRIEAAVAAAAGMGTAALAARRPLSLRTDAGEHLAVAPDLLGRERLLQALAFVGASRVGTARSAGAPASRTAGAPASPMSAGAPESPMSARAR